MAEQQRAWRVDLSGWTTMRQITAWQDTLTSGDIRAVCSILASVVKEWPLEGDPSNPAAYLDLSPQDWASAVREVGQEVGRFFQAALR